MLAIRLTILLLIGLSSAALADRDIVYSGRYYAPPGSHRTTHSHVYRINPDGTGRTQLTFGSTDDESPKWSPDGRKVTYYEDRGGASPLRLCEIDANGGNRRVLKVLSADWEPAPIPVPGYRLENQADDLKSRHVLIALATGRRLTLPVPAHDDVSDALLPAPGHDLLYAANNHDSTVGTDYFFYRLNPDTGAMRYLTEGRFLAWSPDGSRFCMAPGRDTTSYEKRKEPLETLKGASPYEITQAQYRQVYSSPLFVRATAGGPLRQITPRLSFVTGADWRKVK